MISTRVVISTEDDEVGAIVIHHDDDATPVQVAASAHLALQGGSFAVGSETFTVADIEDWLA